MHNLCSWHTDPTRLQHHFHSFSTNLPQISQAFLIRMLKAHYHEPNSLQTEKIKNQTTSSHSKISMTIRSWENPKFRTHDAAWVETFFDHFNLLITIVAWDGEDTCFLGARQTGHCNGVAVICKWPVGTQTWTLLPAQRVKKDSLLWDSSVEDAELRQVKNLFQPSSQGWFSQIFHCCIRSFV